MIGFALILQGLFLGLAFGLRSALHFVQTGSTGFRAFGRHRSLAERAGVLLLIAGGALSVIGSAISALPELPMLDNGRAGWLGVAMTIAGLIVIMWAQFTMGRSWRIGVDPTERTDLVTHGPFAVVRNPIFAGMLLFWAGIAVVVPNVLTLAAPLVALAGIELQVRLVEEPYLLGTHGAEYRAYACRTGRIIPGIGRLRHESGSPETSRTAP